MLAPGKSLGGVRLGDSSDRVRARWGRGFEVCARCAERTWYFEYRDLANQALGVGVAFRRSRVVAVFTLGSPRGWRTTEGLVLGEHVERVQELYGSLRWNACVGYSALTMRGPGAVTSIYTSGETVYGFALARPFEPVCR